MEQIMSGNGSKWLCNYDTRDKEAAGGHWQVFKVALNLAASAPLSKFQPLSIISRAIVHSRCLGESQEIPNY